MGDNKEVNEYAPFDLHKSIHHLDRMLNLLARKCKGRCSTKRRLEEYCAFRLGVVYFKKRFGVGVDDEARLVELLDSIADEMIMSDNHAH